MSDSYPEARRFFDRHILQTMAERGGSFGHTETFFPIRTFTNEWLPKEMARGLLRDLAQRGYCQFRCGLFTEDGEVAGAGYGITNVGLAYYRELMPAPDN
ncbi:hypothetical protein [Paracoccus sp. TOH]|uniref:hypothetical protein n=1 Tax=Paracoccus sp. TOH TaxID=1263728 RepID=UPI0025AEFDCD|nr:hypothetical protein [Paracoccus sp. TOH]WJS87302.1 hypothetical protein NBE95_20705 [Paracoccus sp. TOH]